MSTKPFRPQVNPELRVPLKMLAAHRGLTIRCMVSQVLENFVKARTDLLNSVDRSDEVKS